MPHTSKTGLPPGVSLKRYPRTRPYMAKARAQGRLVYLGNFATPAEAAEAVQLFKQKGIVCRPYSK